MENKVIVGCEEWCELPALGIPSIKARIDSGAKTSSLHAFNIHILEDGNEKIVEFDVHPIQKNRAIIKRCRAKLIDHRMVKSSSGENEKRFVISTPIILGNETWDIEVTLTNRDTMGFRMLIGREAMRGRVLVDPENSFSLKKCTDEDIQKIYNTSVPKKTSLKIALLAKNPLLYSNQRIMEACRSRGHEVVFINANQAYMNITAKRPRVYLDKDRELGHIDAVIPRLRPSMTFYGCAVARQFQAAGAFCLNDAVSIKRARDKLLSLQMLAEKGIDMPVTSFAHSPEDTASLIKHVGGAPLIVKLLEGTQGVGVVLAETNKAAESVISAFKSLKANILVQEFIKEAQGIDIRCFVIDGKVVGSMQRKAPEGEFRANLHRGGVASAAKITKEEKKMAINATKILGLRVAGVDLIRSSTGPKILEVNSSPGLEGIENATGKDIAGMMIEAIEKYIFGKS